MRSEPTRQGAAAGPLLGLSCLLAACSFEPPGPSASPPDGGDAGPSICTTFSSQLDTCTLPVPTDLLLIGMLTFDTDSGVLRSNGTEVSVVTQIVQTQSGEVRALLGRRVIFQASAQLRATGDRGFAIVATDSLTLAASSLIDVSAGGAGNRKTCAGGPAKGEDDGGGAAGGGGGGFGAKGGDGGNGNADGGQSQGGAGGMPETTAPPGVLGGCPGAAGGNQNGSNLGGAPGLGGGAVYLVSKTNIGISAAAGISAGGAGGAGGTRVSSFGDAGGGGGGSGGMIFLEAPVIRSDGTLAANGGGGGQGSGNGAAGQAGATGILGVDAAPGGMNTQSSGTAGGAGGHRGSPMGAKPSQVQNSGGGGGGGAVGIIRVVSADKQLGALVSPDPI